MGTNKKNPVLRRSREILYKLKFGDKLSVRRAAFMSDSVEGILGYKASDFTTGRIRWESLIHSDDIQIVEDAIERSFKRNIPSRIVYRLKHAKTGKFTTVEDVITPEFGRAGKRHAIVGSAVDIGQHRGRNSEMISEIEKDKEYWLEEFQRVAKVGSYLFEVKSGKWSSTPTLDGILGIGPSFKRNVKSWLGLIHPEDRTRVLRHVTGAFSVKKKIDIECRVIRRSDGAVKRVWGTGEVVSDVNGTPVRMFGTIQDITERKESEEALRNERILLRTLVDNLPSAVYVKDKDCRARLINEETARHVGKPQEEIIGRTDFELFPKEIADAFYSDDYRVLTEGVPVLDREEIFFDGQNRMHWQLTSKVPLKDEDGNIIGLVGIGTDITERKLEEEARQRERALLRTLIDNLPNAIFVKDTFLRKTVVNPVHVQNVSDHLRSIGLSLDVDMLGKTDFDVYPRELAEQYLEEDERIIKTGMPVLNREKFFYGENGEPIWVIVSKIPFKDKEGKITGFVGITTDITYIKKVQTALEREQILLKTLINHLPNAIYAKDKELRNILVNPAQVARLEKYAGRLSEQTLLGRTDAESLPGEVAEANSSWDRESVYEGKTVLNREVSQVDLGGQRVWELVSKIPLKDSQGQIIGLVGVSTDITPLREADEKLAKSESKFRLLAENARDLVFRYAVVPTPHFEYVSPSSLDLVGYSPEEHYSDPELLMKIVHPDDRLSLEQILLERFNEDDNPRSIRWVRKDGETIWVEIQRRWVYDDNHELVAFEGIVRDISERKKSEEALRKSQETLSRITSSISDVIYSIDPRTGEFAYLSPTFERKFGYSDEDIHTMGGRWSFLHRIIIQGNLPKDDPVMTVLKESVVHEVPVWENWWRCKDGTTLYIEDHSVPTYKEGKLISVDGVLRDVTERKSAEDAKQSERILLRTLIDNFPHAVYVKDRQYRTVIANPASLKYTGLPSEADALGKTDFDVYPMDVAEMFYADDQRVIRDGQAVINREEFVIDSDGKKHWLLTSKIPLRDAQGQVIGLVGVGMDVTERKLIDEALRQSEAELRALFNSMNDVVIVMDREGKFLKVAPSKEYLLYKPASEIIGKRNSDVFPKDKSDQFMEVVRKTLETGETQNFEYEIDIRGEIKWRAAIVSPMSENTVLWVARDITERKQMEREITESERKYRDLVENALVGVYKTNIKGEFIYANKAMAEMLEYESPQAMMTATAASVYRNSDDWDNFAKELSNEGKTGKSREFEFITKTGKIKNVLLSASLDGGFVSGMVKDITEIRTLERQFIQTQKLEGLGNIAAGIAHNFNNILGVIIGYSELLEQSSFDAPKFERGIKAIGKAADRGKSLVRQLLTFARKTETTLEPLDVNIIINETVKLIEETFPKTIELETNLRYDIPPVLADGTQVQQVLLNLCVNSRDAMPKGGTLSITTSIVPGKSLSDRHPAQADREYVEIRVADSGTGMDRSTRQRIFEPFFTTKDIGKGTGLGLSVVYGIVESHRGFIDVTSEPGQGSIFNVYFPVQIGDFDQLDPSKTGVDDLPGGSGIILVIEDEVMLAELLKSILVSKGYTVLVARDGEEGVETYRRHAGEIALVISDLGLPKLSGEGVVTKIMEINRKAVLIIASGFIDPEIRSALEKRGVGYYIQKPYKSFEVLSAVFSAIESTKSKN